MLITMNDFKSFQLVYAVGRVEKAWLFGVVTRTNVISRKVYSSTSWLNAAIDILMASGSAAPESKLPVYAIDVLDDEQVLAPVIWHSNIIPT